MHVTKSKGFLSQDNLTEKLTAKLKLVGGIVVAQLLERMHFLSQDN